MSNNTSSKRTISEVIKKRRMDANTRQGYFSLLVRTLILILAAWILFSFVFFVTQIRGNDMFPAVKDGDLVVGFRLQHKYTAGDVVVYSVKGQRHIGRVIASQYDVVTMDESGTVLVNGAAQSGEIMYPTYAKDGQIYPLYVLENQIFVLGDYRTQTEDSRDFGAISMKHVEGKVISILRRRGL